MDESDVSTYGDVYDPRSITIADMKQDIIDCVNMLHGNAVVGIKPGKASGMYQYDVSRYVIGWILGIECEAYLVDSTNKAHPDITDFSGHYIYTKNALPFEVFIAQMKELAIAYETEQYQMQRPVAFSNWITTDPVRHPNEPRVDEDRVAIDVEHIRATSAFTLGLFASYHVYSYYPDFLNFPSGDPAVDADPYYAYLRSLVDYHAMPVLISEFGLPTSRGVTHINSLIGLNQGGNSEQQQADGLAKMLDDIYRSGCVGGIVFAWQDEWFKTSWNTMDYDDSAARPKWLNVESSEENFGLLRFSAFPSIQIDGNDSDWIGAQQVGDSSALKADWDESYLYLRLATDDFDGQAFYIPIDTLAGEGSRQFQDATFAREADFVLLLDGKDNTRLLVDPYYNPNYRLYGLQIFTGEELKDFDIKGSGQFIPVKQVISNLMHMPKTGQTVLVQLWDTGKMRYGVSNPSSPDYDSMADFCAGKGFVEIRIPWMLLNFADPSSGKILSNLHTDLPFTFERILSIHMGVGKVGDPAEITMAPYTLPTWGAFPYQQRLKLAYYTLQKAFPEVAMYPISAGEQLTDALRLRNTRLLYVRIDRQIRNTDLITFFLLLIISGAFGAFRKDAVVSVGGYTTHCIGEDMELVVKLHRGLRNAGKPYKIDFLPDPICWTQPPENLRDLYKQRKRWQIGLINVLMRHRDMAFNRKYGKTGLLMLPYYWIFEFIGPIFETMSYFVIPLSWWLGIISWKFTLLFFLLVVMVGLILSLGAILQESYAMRKFPKMSQILTLAAYALIDNFGFRQFNTVIRFIGCLKYRSGKSTWGSMKREKFETKKK